VFVIFQKNNKHNTSGRDKIGKITNTTLVAEIKSEKTQTQH
jgi:hypothetical protein